ncbi:sel1 repeat family protein [Sulfurimonas sp.]|nr:sel1 repeat family protein [Sulfurimonas sp.]
MKKYSLILLVLLNVNINADLIMNGNAAYRSNDYAKALDIYKKACDINIAQGCTHVSTMYFKGNGMDIDTSGGIEYMDKACTLNDAKACYDLAYFYFRGMFVKEDKLKAKDLFSKSCDGGVVKGCNNYKIMNK